VRRFPSCYNNTHTHNNNRPTDRLLKTYRNAKWKSAEGL